MCTNVQTIMTIAPVHHLVNMTEYNYSPEAMERPLATQQCIGHWVDQTLEHPPANPLYFLHVCRNGGNSSSNNTPRQVHFLLFLFYSTIFFYFFFAGLTLCFLQLDGMLTNVQTMMTTNGHVTTSTYRNGGNSSSSRS